MKCTDQKIAVTGLLILAVWIFIVLPLMYFPWKPSGQNTFWGLDSTAWTAIGALSNAAYCALTAGLLVFAVYQVLSTKEDAKITRTLAACERYDIDPVLDRITRRLSIAYNNGSLHANAARCAVDLNSLFNYFESIAIGVARGHYDAEIVRDQFETIMNSHIESMNGIGNWSSGTPGLNDMDHFDKMMALNAKWKNGRAS
ncbi:MAG: hypothetical protein QOI22_1664 [Verrucomicrobiota bacterium]